MTNSAQQTVILENENLAVSNLTNTATVVSETQKKDEKLVRHMANHDLQEVRYLTALKNYTAVEFTNHPSKRKLELIKDHELEKLDVTEGRLVATSAESTVGIAIKLALWKRYSLSTNLTNEEIDNTTALILSALADAEKQMGTY